MNLSAVAIGRTSAYFGQGSGLVQIDSIQCAGTELQLQNCTYTQTNKCGHSDDVGVTCSGEYTSKVIWIVKLLWYYNNALVQFVQLEILGLLVEDLVHLVKVVLKCASTISGAQSVTMGGVTLTQMLFAISLGFQDSVKSNWWLLAILLIFLLYRCQHQYLRWVWFRRGSCSYW